MRSPCCDESGLKKGPWTPEEDQKLVDYISAQGGHGSWKSLPKLAGLNRCGKSCRLRWTNYLKPDIKRGNFSEGEESIIINLHSSLGNKWSKIATYLPGRTDNEIKNYWNTHLRKKLLKMGIDPRTHRPRADLNFLMNLSQFLSPSIGLGLMSSAGPDMSLLRLLQADATQQAKTQYLQNLIQAISTSSVPCFNNILGQFQGLIGNNGSSFQTTIDPLQALLGFPSPLLGPPLPAGDADAISKCNPQEEKLSENNASDGCSLWDSNWYNGLQDEGNTLPELVSAPEFENSQLMVNEMGSITTMDKASFSSNVFGDCNNWKKVMDDEAGGSFWEDIIH